MIKALKSIMQKKSFRDFNIVLAENVVAKGLNFAIIVLLARALGPEDYGIFSVVTVSVMFLVPFLDFGMENTAVRYAGKDTVERKSIFSFYFVLKTAVLAAVLVGAVLFPSKALALLGDKCDPAYLPAIGAGLLVESYLFVFTTHLQAAERFVTRSVLSVGVYGLRLALIAVLLALGRSLQEIIWVYVLSGLPFLLGSLREIAWILKQRFDPVREKPLLHEMGHYQKWLFIGSIAVNIMGRVDFFSVAHYLSVEEAGLYNAAFQLLAPFTMLPFVLGKVFLPKVSKISDPAQARYLMKNIFLLFVVVAGGVALLMPAANTIIIVLYGSNFALAGPVFQTLLISFVFSFWSTMLSLAHYYYKTPQYVVVGAYTQLIIFLVLAGPLVSGHGILGAAWARTASAAAQAVVMLVFILFSWRARRLGGRP